MTSIFLAAILMASTSAPSAEPGWIGLGVTFHQGPNGSWLHVIGVIPEGPAGRAGLRKQDVITAINAKPVPFRNELEMYEYFLRLRPGDRLTLSVTRREGPYKARLKVVALPPQYEKLHKNSVQSLERLRSQSRKTP
jgi:S1-C subfamily serine protease